MNRKKDNPEKVPSNFSGEYSSKEKKFDVDVSEYDAILVAIPILLLVGITVSSSTEIGLAVGVAISAVLSISVMFYGLFVNPPM